METIQLLDSDGNRIENPEYMPLVSDILDEDGLTQLRALYQDMVVVRRIDNEATALQRQGELALWAPLLGQEAAQVGSARALRHDDFAFTSFREHGVAYCRGIEPTAMLQFWRGSTQSGWNPRDHNVTAPAIIVGAQALHATGYAMGVKFDGSDTAVIAYFGDGATSQGDVSEAFAFASSFGAPVVFFCQNNQWAISEPVRVQSHLPLAARGIGFGVPGIQVDGNDVLAVTAATRMALRRAREGSGPTLIEAVTYRMGPHTTSDDPTKYRNAAELDEWRTKDPLARVEKYLESRGALSESEKHRVATLADDVAAQLRAGCLGTVEPTAADMFNHVYAEPHSLVSAERRDYLEYLATFEDEGTYAS
ncbi:pyruvate dehydrogenase (acetyl-transferring) E1 component subunit alpha [Mycobacteroides abscessus subsp. massiliense]|uniref:pyruvate dehydrogenase (acetyl-transferring) E1 component subunit alpha n=1 Tax=Mycobacteroides abscessus TaxID=36809 RepID=UPI00266C72E1|nr:pyruvate dehydrogenase (acetyl-transferring) E1 component subunit alpha [Mycobacteroides abscessus]MDO3301111.1 pyruvate dehydrogenase (acetyl-transferring) E1 component subunit alpha [Mycobacteroides abscessus subsp. massiliense]